MPWVRQQYRQEELNRFKSSLAGSSSLLSEVLYQTPHFAGFHKKSSLLPLFDQGPGNQGNSVTELENGFVEIREEYDSDVEKEERKTDSKVTQATSTSEKQNAVDMEDRNRIQALMDKLEAEERAAESAAGGAETDSVSNTASVNTGVGYLDQGEYSEQHQQEEEEEEGEEDESEEDDHQDDEEEFENFWNSLGSMSLQTKLQGIPANSVNDVSLGAGSSSSIESQGSGIPSPTSIHSPNDMFLYMKAAQEKAAQNETAEHREPIQSTMETEAKKNAPALAIPAAQKKAFCGDIVERSSSVPAETLHVDSQSQQRISKFKQQMQQMQQSLAPPSSQDPPVERKMSKFKAARMQRNAM